MRRFRGNKKRVLAYIGLESSAPDRVAYLQQAVQMLKFINLIELLDCSSFYETEPESDSKAGANKDKIWPVTAVTAIETALSGDELLEVIRDIESRLNNVDKENGRNTKGASENISLELLLFGNETLSTSYLTIPHPSLATRASIIVPMLELAPETVHPQLNKSLAQIHADLPSLEQVLLYGTRKSELQDD
ncbi:MAG: 2-amino-4-hydroxy-6-hydroxymethyldihydropteridine diphosphokinase [Cyanobacteria bacterium TGS_CYA1]|nr:2-amino-4-hydroxy-6-hydroxymethyldihydropteridine diphosphokinase [Cyanobacteria bacterium TGS_CYA1]